MGCEFSIIICGADAAKFAAAEAMYSAAMEGAEWEMIGVHDARSLAEGYNRGFARSSGKIVIFSHDDVEVLSTDLPGRVRRHLQRFDLVGLAGTSRLVNAVWVTAGPPHIFGQNAKPMGNGRIMVDVYCAPRPAVGGIAALDGLFMAARREVLDRVRFDEATFDGFHCYDVDFSFQAYRAGMKLGVACDINLLHHSAGNFDDVWKMYSERFERKWAKELAVHTPLTFQWAAAVAMNKADAAEVMRPGCWTENYPPRSREETQR
jgi:hypothetical protein